MSFEIWIGLLVLGGIAAGLVLLSWLLHWRRQHHFSPRELFLRLCRAHRLRWIEYWWLWQLARHQNLEDPGRLFLEPERFDAARIPAKLHPQMRQLHGLRERLFRVPPEEPSAKRHPETAAAIPSGGPALPISNAPPALNIPPWTSPAADLPPVSSTEETAAI
jgi:hypothetical protein